MKFKIYDLRFTIAGILTGLAVQTHGQPTPAAPASQAEVNAGTLHTKFVAPDTLKGASLGNASVATNVVPGIVITDPVLVAGSGTNFTAKTMTTVSEVVSVRGNNLFSNYNNSLTNTGFISSTGAVFTANSLGDDLAFPFNTGIPQAKIIRFVNTTNVMVSYYANSPANANWSASNVDIYLSQVKTFDINTNYAGGIGNGGEYMQAGAFGGSDGGIPGGQASSMWFLNGKYTWATWLQNFGSSKAAWNLIDIGTGYSTPVMMWEHQNGNNYEAFHGKGDGTISVRFGVTNIQTGIFEILSRAQFDKTIASNVQLENGFQFSGNGSGLTNMIYAALPSAPTFAQIGSVTNVTFMWNSNPPTSKAPTNWLQYYAAPSTLTTISHFP